MPKRKDGLWIRNISSSSSSTNRNSATERIPRYAPLHTTREVTRNLAMINKRSRLPHGSLTTLHPDVLVQIHADRHAFLMRNNQESNLLDSTAAAHLNDENIVQPVTVEEQKYVHEKVRCAMNTKYQLLLVVHLTTSV